MKLSNKLLMGIVAGATFILIALFGFFAFKANGQFKKGKTKLTVESRRLQKVYSANPFPNEDNLAIEKRNIGKVEQQLINLQNRLHKRQIKSEMRSPAEFKLALRDVGAELVELARLESVRLPADYSFGFELYDEGMLPAPQHVPRLHEQLMLMKEIHNVLFTNGVMKVNFSNREILERSEQDLGRGQRKAHMVFEANAGEVPKGALYGKYRFSFEFEAKQDALAAVLNGLSDHEVFMEVKELKLRTTMPTFAPPLEEDITDKKPAPAVSGLSALQATLAGEEAPVEAPVIQKQHYMAVKESAANVSLIIDVFVFPAPGKAG